MEETFSRTDYLDAINSLTNDPKNSRIFASKIRELELEINDLKVYVRSLYHKNLEEWFFTWIKELNEAKMNELEKQIRKMDFYRMKCLGQVKKYDVDISVIKTIPIKDVIGVQMDRQSKKRAYFPCPLHNEKKPSFVWYKDSNSFYCFGCNSGGTVIDLYMKLYEVSVSEAIKGLKFYL